VNHLQLNILYFEEDGAETICDIRGQRQYEITNHLWNVLATISDCKVPVDNNADKVTDFYNPYILMLTNYWPFGQPIFRV
jgi:hypothetical protein